MIKINFWGKVEKHELVLREVKAGVKNQNLILAQWGLRDWKGDKPQVTTSDRVVMSCARCKRFLC